MIYDYTLVRHEIDSSVDEKLWETFLNSLWIKPGTCRIQAVPLSQLSPPGGQIASENTEKNVSAPHELPRYELMQIKASK